MCQQTLKKLNYIDKANKIKYKNVVGKRHSMNKI